MKVSIVVIVLVLVGGLIWWFTQGDTSNTQVNQPDTTVSATGVEYEIVLTNDGFVPKESSIGIGDTVVFRSETGRPFWPASNLHPSHRDYPEFDPREPILADETWSFTFTKSGTWKFHDHLAPYYTGVIEVSQ